MSQCYTWTPLFSIHTSFNEWLYHETIPIPLSLSLSMQAMVGLGALQALAEEIVCVDMARAEMSLQQVIEARNVASKYASNNTILRAQVGMAERKVSEQAALLQSCVFQHIGTVHDMSNRFYNLENQYNVLRTRETTATAGTVHLLYLTPTTLL